MKEIVKGDQLMVFYGSKSIGHATSHTLSETTQTSEVNSKDFGAFSSVTPTKVSWELSAEHLFTEDFATIQKAMHEMNEVEVVFGYADPWDKGGLDAIGEDDAHPDNWTPASTGMVKGKAYITSLSVTAASGDNATMSVTFSGVGQLTDWA